VTHFTVRVAQPLSLPAESPHYRRDLRGIQHTSPTAGRHCPRSDLAGLQQYGVPSARPGARSTAGAATCAPAPEPLASSIARTPHASPPCSRHAPARPGFCLRAEARLVRSKRAGRCPNHVGSLHQYYSESTLRVRRKLNTIPHTLRSHGH
jgi:hypothetical protein